MRWMAIAGLACILLGAIGVILAIVRMDRGPDWLLDLLAHGGAACLAIGLTAVLAVALVVAVSV
jgi:multisubunit Na+/H+ antiporter MnhG subunit